MDRLITREKLEDLVSEVPVAWLTQEPDEMTSHWILNESGDHEEDV